MKGRPNSTFKRSYNCALDLLAWNKKLESISNLSKLLDVSRTTGRQVIHALANAGILDSNSEDLRAIRPLVEEDYYPLSETRSLEQAVSLGFALWINENRIRPRQQFDSFDLAQAMGISRTQIKEFLIKLSRIGFVSRLAPHIWRIEELPQEFSEELMEFRELVEPRAARDVALLEDDNIFWARLHNLDMRHRSLQRDINDRYLDVLELDQLFHATIGNASRRIMIGSLQDAMILVFYSKYHFLRTPEQILASTKTVVADHIELIEAIQTKDPNLAESAMRKHLANSRLSLYESGVHP